MLDIIAVRNIGEDKPKKEEPKKTIYDLVRERQAARYEWQKSC